MERKLANILGCNVDQVNQSEALAAIKAFIAGKRPAHIITLNAEIIYQACSSPELKAVINKANLVTPDGVGTVWAGRRQGYDFPERVTGIDLLYRICAEASRSGWRIFLLGAAPGVAEKASRELMDQYPGLEVCGCRDGYFKPEEEAGIIDQIQALKPDVLFVALGAPAQEFWISRNKEMLNVPVCIGVGGSLDVVSGDKARAPRLMIRLHLEWLYRLMKEPSRWRRQLALPRFVAAVIRQER